jgi:glycerol kinase
MGLLVGIDQGTSGTTVLLLDNDLEELARASRPLSSVHLDDGGTEQDPWAVLATIVEACGEALDGVGDTIEAAGLAHQGETVLAWDPVTREPLTPAIVWSDRRAETVARRLIDQGLREPIEQLSGMRLDSYFCASKYRWLLDATPGLAERAEVGEAHLGTLETWLGIQLGAPFRTDIGTASRTQLTRPGSRGWDPELLGLFGLSADWLAPIWPTVRDRGTVSHQSWDFTLPLRAVLVDQPAALVGNGGLDPGALKVTYGTGAFVLANAGRAHPGADTAVIASVGWDDDQGPVYVLDGGVLSVGSALDWLATLGIDTGTDAHRRLVGRGPSSLVVVPALDGSGAPRWERLDTASISGITSATDGDDLVQAFLDSFTFRVAEILEAMVATGIPRPSALRADGGLSRSEYLMQRQADVLGIPVHIAANTEATAVGAAVMAAGPDRLPEWRSRLTAISRVFDPIDVSASQQAFARWLSLTSGSGTRIRA